MMLNTSLSPGSPSHGLKSWGTPQLGTNPKQVVTRQGTFPEGDPVNTKQDGPLQTCPHQPDMHPACPHSWTYIQLLVVGSSSLQPRIAPGTWVLPTQTTNQVVVG